MNICLRMYIQYFCGENGLPVSDINSAGAGSVDYAGCMVSASLLRRAEVVT